MKSIYPLLLLIGLLSSCRHADDLAGNRPIVDTRGIDPQVYDTDLQECYVFADEVQAGRKIVSATAAGAVAGGVIGTVAGNSQTAKTGAGVGAASGTLKGSANAMQERQRVVKNCLSGRGYLVLN